MEILKNDTDYAMRALVYLAQHVKEGPVAVKSMAKSQEIPDKFAYKILQKLSKAGLTKAHMGPLGGFVLAEDPGKITLLRVMEAMQGAVTMRDCLLNVDMCPRHSECPVSVKLGDLQNNLVQFLEGVTLADVLEAGYKRQGNIAK